MTDRRAPDTLLVRSALGSRSNAVRAFAALAVGQVRAAALFPDLRLLLRDADTAVAANAAYSLGLARDSAAVATLGEALGSLGPAAAEAAWALGQIGEPSRRIVEEALAAPAAPGEVLGELLLAAAKLRPVPVRQVTAHLRGADPEVRWRAAYALSRPLVPAGVRILAELGGDPSAEVRAQVARALTRNAAGDTLRAVVTPVLERLAGDADAHVRVNAVRSLASYGSLATTAVVAAMSDADPNVRITAAQVAVTVLPAQKPVWVQAWNSDTAFTFRRVLLASALRAGVALAALSGDAPGSWVASADWRRRAAAAEAAAGARATSTLLELALPAVGDDDARVRSVAYGVFAPYADSAPRFAWRRELFMPALADPDPHVRARILGALTRSASAREAPAVLATYHAARRDSASDARAAAMRYLAAAWRRDSLAFPDSLRAALAALPAPGDPTVRAAAAGLSPLARWDSASSTDRPLGWYEARVRSLVVPALRGDLPRARITTERGVMELELFALDAPLTVFNFETLARSGFHVGTRFHRVVPNFVIQAGEPRGDGSGRPPFAIRDELNRRRYDRGAVGMALSGPDTGGSQFFITHAPQPHLDGGYTVFGRVLSGWDVLDAIVQGDRIQHIGIR
ncbi:MAG: peptidylprolyl isomerase [Gemmatimonadaceae bacterium]